MSSQVAKVGGGGEEGENICWRHRDGKSGVDNPLVAFASMVNKRIRSGNGLAESSQAPLQFIDCSSKMAQQLLQGLALD
jgi:hypothetical protein